MRRSANRFAAKVSRGSETTSGRNESHTFFRSCSRPACRKCGLLREMAQPILIAPRAMTKATLALGVVVVDAKPAQAQSSRLMLLDADYGTPERCSASVAGLFRIREEDGPEFFTP